jgi:hypothetical protein
MKARSWALLSSIALAAGIACGPLSERTGTETQFATELDKVEWLDKAAKMLRYGDGLGPDDDVHALAAMSKEDVIDHWMKDRRFGDAVLAFNLYYLGRSIDQVKRPSAEAGSFEYDRAAFDLPQTLESAKAVLAGGDYFTLFDSSPSFLTMPAQPVLRSDPAERERVGRDMDAAIEKVPTDRAGACEAFTQAGLQATNRLRLLGFAPAVQLRQTWLTKHPLFPRTVDCAPDSTLSSADLAGSMRTVRTAIDAIWKGVEDRPQNTRVASILDLPEVRVAAEGLPPVVSPLGAGFFGTVPSTSTNFHRKRASYVLKTYFCDDMTPLDLPQAETGDGGTSDVHASNSTCQACHYRLDPIGALFRNIGVGGRDYTGQGKIKFDDQVLLSGQDYEHYLAQWQNTDGSYRAGYWVLGRDGKPQREPTWTDADGDTLNGLWGYLRRSKVVKACLVKKLAEYVLGPKQVYDREWLAQISAGLHEGPQSADSFKAVVKSLLLSKTFSMHDPAKGVCYDIPEGASPNRSPCAIAHVVSGQCAGCHSSVSGPGHLDFTRWVDVGGGVFSWPHTDQSGVQLAPAESRRRMLERITSTDRRLRMPLLRAMPAEDFATFRTWLTTENP